ncbi:MAG: hypothetical protein JSR58_06865 [Verrucomicrobia bacterium]|nr:hypothetical protein [Verrucomicrobiota bacterium]
MEPIRPGQTPPSQGPSSGTPTPQTRWSAAGAHLGSRLSIAEANMINGVGESSKEQKYADTAIEVFYIFAQLRRLCQESNPPNQEKVKALLAQLKAINPDLVFKGDFTIIENGKEYKFNLKQLIDLVSTATSFATSDQFNQMWQGYTTTPPFFEMPPIALCIVAILQYKGSDMKMDLYGNPNGAKNFFEICMVMAEISQTSAIRKNFDATFWGWSGSFGNFADIFPDMLMVYLYKEYIKNDTPEEWKKLQDEFARILGQMPVPQKDKDGKYVTPHYAAAYNKLQEWAKDRGSWESWDDLPVGYSRDFIENDVAFPAWKEWRKT